MNPSTITLVFLVFAIVMFVTEKIPLALTSMIVCVGLVITNVLDWKAAFSGFIDSNVILFVAMFIVGGALFETGMANKVGGIVTHFAKSERQLIVAIMVIVGLMSGVLSNTGTAAVLIPVVIGIAAKSGFARSRLLMPLVFAAAMGGNLSLIGAPGNLIGQTALQEMGLSFGFFEYAIVGMPILIVGIIFYATIGFKLLPNHKTDGGTAFDEVKDFSDVPVWKQNLSLAILVLTLLAMIFEKEIGIKLHISGCIGALALILTGVISEKDALKSIDLKTIFLFGGTLSLAAALKETGAGEQIANAVIALLPLLITAMGGALGTVIKSAPVIEELGNTIVALGIPGILIPWAVAVITMTAVGSMTTAGMTAAAIVLPMMPILNITPIATTIAIGAGTLMVNHVNNSCFWILGQFFNLDTKQSFKYVTFPCALASILGVILAAVGTTVGIF